MSSVFQTDCLLGVPLAGAGSGRQRYAVAMLLYTSGEISAAVLETYRVAAAHDSLSPRELLDEWGLAVAENSGFLPLGHKLSRCVCF